MKAEKQRASTQFQPDALAVFNRLLNESGFVNSCRDSLDKPLSKLLAKGSGNGQSHSSINCLRNSCQIGFGNGFNVMSPPAHHVVP